MFCVFECVSPRFSPFIYFPFFCFFCWNFLKWDWMVLAAFSTSKGLSGGTGEVHVPLQALESERDRRQEIAREAEATAEQAKTAAKIEVPTHVLHWNLHLSQLCPFPPVLINFRLWFYTRCGSDPFRGIICGDMNERTYTFCTLLCCSSWGHQTAKRTQ